MIPTADQNHQNQDQDQDSVAVAMAPPSDRDSVSLPDVVEAYPPPGGYFSDLPPIVKRVPYHSFQQCMAAREEESQRQDAGESEECEWMLFTGVGKRTFERDFLDSDDESHETTFKRALASYNADNNLLVIKLPETHQHSTAGMAFIGIFMTLIAPMGLLGKVITGGGDAVRIFLRGHTKAADAHMRPARLSRDRLPDDRLPRDRDFRWPSMVLEVAWSDTKTKLMADIAQWLCETGGNVKIVFTICIGKLSRELELAKWVLDASGRPQKEQAVKMAWANECVQFPGRSEIIIRFKELMLRDPEEAREKDIVYDREALDDLAGEIWAAQDEYDLDKADKHNRQVEGQQ